MTDEERGARLFELVARIYRGINDGTAPVVQTGTDLAEQYYACLLAATGLFLRARGIQPWSEIADGITNDIAFAAAVEMERAFERGLVERN